MVKRMKTGWSQMTPDRPKPAIVRAQRPIAVRARSSAAESSSVFIGFEM